MRSMDNSIFIFPSATKNCMHIQYTYKRISRILQRLMSVSTTERLQTCRYLLYGRYGRNLGFGGQKSIVMLNSFKWSFVQFCYKVLVLR